MEKEGELIPLSRHSTIRRFFVSFVVFCSRIVIVIVFMRVVSMSTQGCFYFIYKKKIHAHIYLMAY